jgi:dUTP pyrophosphatase
VLRYKRVSPSAYAPTRGSYLAAGIDLWADRRAVVPAHGQVRIPTGIELALPPGTYGRIAPRSSLAYHHGLDVGGQIFPFLGIVVVDPPFIIFI